MSNFLDINELCHLINRLIQKKHEGVYFKQEPYINPVSLLHDIICMANVLRPGNRYIIIGVENGTGKIKRWVDSNKFIDTQAKILDVLSKAPFAGDIRPEVEVHNIIIRRKPLLVIVIGDTPHKPFFLSEKCESSKEGQKKSKNLSAGTIYHRIEDRNTGKDQVADLYHIEKMWRQRFGLDISPLARYRNLLEAPQNWCSNPANTYLNNYDGNYSHDVFPLYHKNFPEFQIKTTAPESGSGESFSYFYPNSKSYYEKAKFKYHSTILFELDLIYCDEIRLLLPFPDCKRIGDGHADFFYYFVMDSYKGLFLKFLRHHLDHFFDSGRGGKAPILVFDDELQLNRFTKAAKANIHTINSITPDYGGLAENLRNFRKITSHSPLT